MKRVNLNPSKSKPLSDEDSAAAKSRTEVLVFQSCNSTLNVYRSDYAGINKVTAVTWAVGDELENIVDELKLKGVKFEHYDMPDLKREGDIYSNGTMKAAWFKDPDGNILNLVNVDA